MWQKQTNKQTKNPNKKNHLKLKQKRKKEGKMKTEWFEKHIIDMTQKVLNTGHRKNILKFRMP